MDASATDRRVVSGSTPQIVRLMDGLNRYRFASDSESLASWESARNTIGRRGSGAAGQSGGTGTFHDATARRRDQAGRVTGGRTDRRTAPAPSIARER
jgi:hypothetical protein